ncbi:MAG: baseplate J/gp47 family protein [Methanomicrobiaceae archaeon]|nr:baseplate J/gp47 family protein [Methanomicrobiaceae archaeon]
MTEYGVIPEGFRAKTYPEVLESLMSTARTVFGFDVDLTTGSLLGQFVRSIAVEMTTLYQQEEAVYYSGFISSAEGQSLDRVVALVGIKRRAASKASGTVTFSVTSAASAAIPIPAGTVVGTSDESLLFETTEAGTIEVDETSVNISVTALTAGSEGNVSGDTVTKLVSSISSIDSVANASTFTGGGDAETDTELRIRTMTMKPAAKGTVAALQAAILALDGVMDVNVAENTETHTISIAVSGGDSDDISAAIEDTRPCGIPVTWGPASGFEISVTAVVKMVTGSVSSDVQAEVEEAITAWLEAKKIGEDLTYTQLIKAVTSCSGVDEVTTLSMTDGTNTADSIGESIAVAESACSKAGTITVTVS